MSLKGRLPVTDALLRRDFLAGGVALLAAQVTVPQSAAAAVPKPQKSFIFGASTAGTSIHDRGLSNADLYSLFKKSLLDPRLTLLEP